MSDRITSFFQAEAATILASIKNIQKLLPHPEHNSSAHNGEEGSYLEYLLRAFLNKHLPLRYRAYTGFILRPAVKKGDHDRSRREKEIDTHSSQLDIIIYDTADYPIFEQYEEFVIVPPEGVIAIISVKKTLRNKDVPNELKALQNAVFTCRSTVTKKESHTSKDYSRLPVSVLFGFDVEKGDWVKKSYAEINKYGYESFDEAVNAIICLKKGSIFKVRPKGSDPKEVGEKFDNKAKYEIHTHASKKEGLALQILLTVILSMCYDVSRTNSLRAGFTSIPRDFKTIAGIIPVNSLRVPKS